MSSAVCDAAGATVVHGVLIPPAEEGGAARSAAGFTGRTGRVAAAAAAGEGDSDGEDDGEVAAAICSNLDASELTDVLLLLPDGGPSSPPPADDAVSRPRPALSRLSLSLWPLLLLREPFMMWS